MTPAVLSDEFWQVLKEILLSSEVKIFNCRPAISLEQVLQPTIKIMESSVEYYKLFTILYFFVEGQGREAPTGKMAMTISCKALRSLARL